MFGTKNPTIYTNITFTNTLTDPLLKKITENRLEALNELINACDLQTDDGMYDAVQYAQKMAIFHGVPGLLRYVELQTNMMVERFTNGEDISGQCVNTLGYLKLAKLIAESDSDSYQSVLKILPEEKITDKNYWQTKEKLLERFGDISHYQDEAQKIADSMFHTNNTVKHTK